jgi:hypothetical protein
MDPQLNFKFHIKSIEKKISTGLYFLRTAKNKLTKKSIKLLYYSLIHCHLIYANHIWSCTSQSNLNVLIKLQKYAVRIVSAAGYNAHTEPLFKANRILPLPQLTQYFKLQFMQQYKHGLLPKSFSGEWASEGDRLEDQEQGRMVLRNMNLNDFTVPFSRLASTDRFPLSSFPKAWNSLDNVEIKSIRCKSDFNAKLKEHLLGQLDPNFKCTRLLCPHCHFN